MTKVLVVNSGSSSLKYQLIETDTEELLAKGLIERIGQDVGAASHTSTGSSAAEGEWSSDAPVADHAAAFRAMTQAFAEHGPALGDGVPAAIGHRVVQGGARFSGPTLITEATIADIDDLSALAPLHNPPALAGILAARDAFPGVPEVAIFDTAFHTSLPPAAYTYAIDRELAAANRVRRYGFHGTSHKYVSERAIAFLGLERAESRIIVMHLGNGASACAVSGGQSVETSMGMTPLEGLVMGTRSGDVDPAVLFHLHRKAGLSFEQLDTLLNRGSGLLGLSGSGDLRDVQARATGGDVDAELAIEVYVHRLKHYIGAYLAQLGGADAIVFTAGVGENSPLIRQRAVAGLEGLGIELDEARNLSADRGERIISTDASRTALLVIPTNEELEIARQTASAL